VSSPWGLRSGSLARPYCCHFLRQGVVVKGKPCLSSAISTPKLTEPQSRTACVPIDFCDSLSGEVSARKSIKVTSTSMLGCSCRRSLSLRLRQTMKWCSSQRTKGWDVRMGWYGRSGSRLGVSDEDARVVPGLLARMRASSSNNTNYNKDRHLARIHLEWGAGRPTGHVQKKGHWERGWKICQMYSSNGFLMETIKSLASVDFSERWAGLGI